MASTYRQARSRGMDLLSRSVSPVCFVRVSTAPLSLGVRIICIALAGTVGAIGTLGHRRGGVTAPFAASGFGLAPGSSQLSAVLLGLTVHVAWIVLWSVVLAALVQRVRRPRASLVAVAVAASAFVVSTVVAAPLAGPVAALPTAPRALVHVVLAISFVLGMRLAPRG